LKNISLGGLISDDISWFGEKYKALRDFVSASNTIAREKPM